MTTSQTKILSFSETSFFELVEAYSGCSSPPDQVRYLATYLAHTEVAAKTMVAEEPYIDRHYLQEYVGYYASLARPPRSSRAARIHFFRNVFDEAQWSAWTELTGEALRDQGRSLSNDYLGYVVIRPLPACPVGRTVLRPFPSGSRNYGPASTVHEAHLHGFTLQVPSLPFQQQDQGLGACATTALWCALARVTRADGGRAVTPLDVARAAPTARGSLVTASTGLDLDQMTGTVRALGYEPHVFRPSNHDIFTVALKACIRSGIPVILRVNVQPSGERHALTIAGMRESDELVSAEDVHIGSGGFTAAVRGISRLYLHDDRLGPYARSTVKVINLGEALHYALQFDPQHEGFEGFDAPVTVESAIVPLYPKIRITPEDLVAWVSDLLPVLADLAGTGGKLSLRVEMFYALGGDYLAGLGDVLTDLNRLGEIRRSASLSRYVAVARFSIKQKWFADFVLDTTDVKREATAAPLLLATGVADIVEELRVLVRVQGSNAFVA